MTLSSPRSSGTVPSPERVHLSALDGVRGVAITMVMLMHSLEGNFDGASLRTLGEAINLGRLGVDLFFVLSGFLITGILMDTRHDPAFFRRFYMRRTLRIFPLYYGVLGILLLLTPVLHLQWKGMFFWMLLYAQNFQPLRILSFYLAPLHLGLYHLWSLAVEEQFYLVWPFVVFLLKGQRRAVGIAATGLTVAVILARLWIIHSGGGLEYIHVGMFTRADQLLLGAILATLYRSESWWPRVAQAGPWLFAAVVLFQLSVWASTGHLERASLFYIIGFGYTLFALACAGAMAWSLKSGSILQRIMQTAPLRILGKYSYGLYILHVPVITMLGLPMRHWMRLHFHSRLLSVILPVPLVLALSFLLAWVSYNFYEKRFLRLKHHFDYTRVSPARVAAGSTEE
jgi:peptidoglycan/LPS O-acetylase OafA/YrhL